MVAFNQTLDTSKQPENNFAAVPPGDYLCDFVAEKPNSKHTGVVLEFVVSEGPFANRKFYVNIGLPPEIMVMIVGSVTEQASQGSIDMGKRLLTSLGNACGKPAISSTDELLYSKVILEVGLQSNDKTRNQVNSFKPYMAGQNPAFNAAAQPPQGQPAPAQQQQAPAQAAQGQTAQQPQAAPQGQQQPMQGQQQPPQQPQTAPATPPWANGQ